MLQDARRRLVRPPAVDQAGVQAEEHDKAWRARALLCACCAGARCKTSPPPRFGSGNGPQAKIISERACCPAQRHASAPMTACTAGCDRDVAHMPSGPLPTCPVGRGPSITSRALQVVILGPPSLQKQLGWGMGGRMRSPCRALRAPRYAAEAPPGPPDKGGGQSL